MTDKPEGEPEEKKIIIDADWKSQVEAEKEELRRKQKETEAAEATAESAAEARPRAPLPPPTLEILASSLGMQAMVAMGLVPNPMGGKSEVDLDQAKHLIDMIAMLEEKTEGNRTLEESWALDSLLHELRMSYVAVGQKQAGS